ncbi:MAG: hypothetical protein WDM90_12185 [Ferruginibacter sp.]
MFRKISAAFLLLNLIAITAIQVLHTHPSGSIVSQKKTGIEKNAVAGFYKAPADSKCFICDYQLTKDADANYAVFNINVPIVFNDVALITYNFTAQDIQAVFETRGPPAI